MVSFQDRGAAALIVRLVTDPFGERLRQPLPPEAPGSQSTSLLAPPGPAGPPSHPLAPATLLWTGCVAAGTPQRASAGPGRRPDKCGVHVHTQRGGAVTSRGQNPQDPATLRNAAESPSPRSRTLSSGGRFGPAFLCVESLLAAAPAVFREQFNRRRAARLPSRAIGKLVFPGHPSHSQDPRWALPGCAYLSSAAAQVCCGCITTPRTTRSRGAVTVWLQMQHQL